MADARGPLPSLIRRAWLVGLCALLAAGAALALSLRQDQEKEYEATAELLSEPTSSRGVPAWRNTAYQLELVAADAVARRVADRLENDLTTADVTDKVVIDGDTDITITASDPDSGFATELANAYAREALQELPAGGTQIAERARSAESSSSRSVARSTAVGAVLGLMLGAVLALLLGRFDRRLQSAEELGEAFGLPVLVSVPDSSSLASHLDGKHPDKGLLAPLPFVEAEAFRMLGARLRYLDSGRDTRSVVVTSALPGEGKTTVAANLARAQAAAGSSVCLVEADLRKPRLTGASGLRELPGLAEVVTGESPLDDAVQQISDRNGTPVGRPVDVIVAGTTPANPADLTESPEMQELVKKLSARYELVVIDAPPPTVLADAIPLLRLADGVLVVAQVGRSTPEGLASLREELQSIGAHVLGVVANRAQDREARYGEHYRTDRAAAGVRSGSRTGDEPEQQGSTGGEPPKPSPAAREGEPAGRSESVSTRRVP